MSVESRTKMRLAKLGKPSPRKGKRHTEEAKEKMRQAHLGKEFSEATKKKMSQIAKERGFGKWMTGRHLSVESLKKRTIKQSGKNHWNWKDNEVGYGGLHDWIRKMFGSAKNFRCMICGGTRGSKRIEWANLDGKYTRDPATWTTMCKKCHNFYDGINKNLWKNRKKLDGNGRPVRLVRVQEYVDL